MNNEVASLELCRELYELSEWDDTYLRWARFREPRVVNADEWARNMSGEPDLIASGDSIYVEDHSLTPAYSLGYLLRKLPTRTTLLHIADSPEWYASLDSLELGADTAEDAACKLAIQLFKAGILTREEVI